MNGGDGGERQYNALVVIVPLYMSMLLSWMNRAIDIGEPISNEATLSEFLLNE